ncbi:hypothetical protein LX36DRAFT_342040 [Colletotrichum falcatum]|nr:hypothetical protein LX36DRAFT_342040 [Colletotrichum falcatum]
MPSVSEEQTGGGHLDVDAEVKVKPAKQKRAKLRSMWHSQSTSSLFVSIQSPPFRQTLLERRETWGGLTEPLPVSPPRLAFGIRSRIIPSPPSHVEPFLCCCRVQKSHWELGPGRPASSDEDKKTPVCREGMYEWVRKKSQQRPGNQGQVLYKAGPPPRTPAPGNNSPHPTRPTQKSPETPGAVIPWEPDEGAVKPRAKRPQSGPKGRRITKMDGDQCIP